MGTIRARIVWDGPGADIMRVLPDSGQDIGAEVWDEDITLFRPLDADESLVGEVVGVEIVGFLSFNRWADLPKLDILWQLPGWKPLPLDKLLKRVQKD
ncbi:MAG: hypothetical protein M0T85_03945, partial [Dehalococcoidales bacterium]|nr:hypothetical protein [Dehalococcoidales bacterium]